MVSIGVQKLWKECKISLARPPAVRLAWASARDGGRADFSTKVGKSFGKLKTTLWTPANKRCNNKQTARRFDTTGGSLIVGQVLNSPAHIANVQMLDYTQGGHKLSFFSRVNAQFVIVGIIQAGKINGPGNTSPKAICSSLKLDLFAPCAYGRSTNPSR